MPVNIIIALSLAFFGLGFDVVVAVFWFQHIELALVGYCFAFLGLLAVFWSPDDNAPR